MNGLVESVGRGFVGPVPSFPFGVSTVAGTACYCSGDEAEVGAELFSGACY